MKKTLTLLSVLCCIACTEEMENPNEGNQTPAADGKEIVISAKIDNGVDSKVSFVDDGTSKAEVSWKESGESFTAFVGSGTVTPVTFNQTSGNYFKGVIPEGTASGTALYAIYPAQDITSGSASSFDLNLSTQSGAGLDETNTLMYAKGTVGGELVFRHMASVLKVKMKFSGLTSGTATAVTFGSDDLIYKAKADITGPAPVLSSHESGTIGLTGSFTISSAGEATAYVYLLPGTSSSEITVCAAVGDRTFKGVIPARTGGAAIASGKVYTASLTLEEYVQKAFYVTTEGTATGSGASWADPTTLSNALARVPEGGEIHIAAGTYKPDTYLPYTDCANDEASKGFHINRNITIQGGYPVSPDTDATADPAANTTILSGNNTSYHVVYVSAPRSETAKVCLNGVKITAANGTGAAEYVINNTFDGKSLNVAANHGGALTVIGSNMELNDIKISENTATHGVAAFIAHSNVRFKNGMFHKNTGADAAKSNGAVYILHNGINVKSDVVFENCVLRYGSSFINGSCIYAYNKADNSGGIDVTVINSAIYSNSTGDRVNFFRNVDTQNKMNIIFVNTTISKNSSKHSSAMCLDGADADIISCTITENTFTNTPGTSTKGGAICVQGSTGSLDVYNSIITGNHLASVTDSKNVFTKNVSHFDIHRYNETPKVKYYHTLLGSYIYGSRYYNADGTNTSIYPLFRYSSQLADLAQEGDTYVCKLNGSKADNLAIKTGMPRADLMSLASTNVTAAILGRDQSGKLRTTKPYMGATTLTSGENCVSDPYLLSCGDNDVHLIRANDIANGGAYTGGKIWTYTPSGLGVTVDNLSECKPADNGRKLLVTSSYQGSCVAVDMVSKEKLFYATGIPQAHSAELLPNDCIVVAVAHETDNSSTDNQLRVYKMGTNKLLSTVSCSKAHGVYWSEKYQRLYAVGDVYLSIYTWNSSTSKLTLESKIDTHTKVSSLHDLTYVSDDEILLSGNRSAIYNMSSGAITQLENLARPKTDAEYEKYPSSKNFHTSLKSVNYNPLYGIWYTDASETVGDRAGDTWSTVKLRYRKDQEVLSDTKYIKTSGVNTYKMRVLHW